MTMTIKVKICGIRTAGALAACVHGRADYIGLVFYPPSPRFLTPEKARDLCGGISGNPAKVALTVDAGDALLDDIITHVAPACLQLHGSETPARVRAVQTRFHLPVIKAIPVADERDIEAARGFEDVADMLLFDAKPRISEGAGGGTATLPGGNARVFDWRLLAGQKWARPWFLSGGLDAHNVAEAVACTGAHGVDVSSGVERTRGHKDPALITEFLETIAAL